MKNHQLFSQQR